MELFITFGIAIIFVFLFILRNIHYINAKKQFTEQVEANRRLKKEVEARGQLISSVNQKLTSLTMSMECSNSRHLEELKSIQQARESAENRLKAATQERKDKEAVIENLENTLKENAQKIESLNNQLELETANGANEDEIRQLNKEIDSLLHQLKKKQQAYEFLEDQVDELKEELDLLSSNFENEAFEEEDDQEETAPPANEIYELNESLVEAEQELDNQEQIIVELHNKLNQLTQENEFLKNKVRELNKPHADK